MDGSHSLLIRSQQFGTQMPQGGHPPHHSITSSAATSNVCGIARPSAFAVLRLTTSSNFTVCWTGKSPGFSPEKRCRETDCMAGHVRLELRNVVAKYPFERSHGFQGIQPNSGYRDYSCLSCGVWETQLGPNARISAGMLARTLVNRKTRGQLLGRACHAI